MQNEPNSLVGEEETSTEDAGRVCKGSLARVMAAWINLISDLCCFSGKSRLAAAHRHDMGHTETLVERPSTPIGE